MFYFVTYLDLITLKIRLYEYTQSKNQVEELLNNVAINFIRTENGERRVNTAYVEKIEDIQEDGYYLICSKEVPNVIDVYYRKTNVVSGWFLNGADISVDKVGRFSVSETSLNLPSEVEQTSTKVIKPQCQNQQLSFSFSNVLNELKERYKEVKEKNIEPVEKPCGRVLTPIPFSHEYEYQPLLSDEIPNDFDLLRQRLGLLSLSDTDEESYYSDSDSSTSITSSLLSEY